MPNWAPVSTIEPSGPAGEPASAGRLMSEIAAANVQAKIFIPASLVDPISTDKRRNRFPALCRGDVPVFPRLGPRGPPQICHVAIAKDCRPSAPFEPMLSNTLESMLGFTPPDSWLATGSYGGDLSLVWLGSIDRRCYQFPIALQP